MTMSIPTNKVKDLTVDELKNIIRETVLETLEDYIDIEDVDQNLTVKEDIKQQLLAIKKRRNTNKTSISATEVYAKLGIDN